MSSEGSRRRRQQMMQKRMNTLVLKLPARQRMECKKKSPIEDDLISDEDDIDVDAEDDIDVDAKDDLDIDDVEAVDDEDETKSGESSGEEKRIPLMEKTTSQ